MKKLTKNSLAKMADLLPELDAEDQRCILGGTASTSVPPDYTGTIPEPTVTTTPVDPYAVSGSMPTATTPPASTAPTGASPEPTGVLYIIEGRDYMLYERNDGSAYIEYIDEEETKIFECDQILNPPTYSFSTEEKTSSGECPACSQFEQINNPLGAQGPDKTVRAKTTPLGELFFRKYILSGHSDNCPYK